MVSFKVLVNTGIEPILTTLEMRTPIIDRSALKSYHTCIYGTVQQHATTRLPRPCDIHSLRLLGVSNSPGGDGTAPLLPREYTEEEKVSLAVTRLAQNEELLGALAWRLGIPVAGIRQDGREPPLARDGKDYADEEELEGNRDQIEVSGSGCAIP